MAYGGSPSSVSRDAVRLLVGDVSTSTSSEWLTNTDYDYFVAQTSSVYVAAQLAANSLSALFAGPSSGGEDWVERKVGDLTIKRSEATGIASEFRKLAHKLGRMAAAGVTPYAGGISQSDKDGVESDTDRTRPAFTRKLFDSPYALDATRSSTEL